MEKNIIQHLNTKVHKIKLYEYTLFITYLTQFIMTTTLLTNYKFFKDETCKKSKKVS